VSADMLDVPPSAVKHAFHSETYLSSVASPGIFVSKLNVTILMFCLLMPCEVETYRGFQ
jgi:hypothetical protein